MRHGPISFIVMASAIGLCSGSAHGQIIVNEFLASPDGLQEEFIELLNTSSWFVPLRDIAFRDSRSDWIAVGGDEDARLAPGELLVLSMEAQPVWPDISLIRPQSWASLNNSGDSIVVSVGASVTDRVGYGSNARGISLERIDPAVPGHLGLNWGASSASSGATPGRVNARFRPDIRPPLLRGAEFDAPSSLILWLSEPVDPSSLAGARVTADDSVIDAAGSRVDGARIGLQLQGGRAPDVISVGGLFDFAGLRMRDTTLAVAIPSSTGDALLTELLVEAGPGLGDLPEFVEIAARGARPVSLRGAVLAVGHGPEPLASLLSDPDSTRILVPGGCLIVYVSRASDSERTRLHNLIISAIDAHTAAAGSMCRQIDVAAADPRALSLRNSGDLVRLLSPDGVELDAVQYEPAWNDVRISDHRGRSIRRVLPHGPAALQWASSLHESGATPGQVDLGGAEGSRPVPGDLEFSELLPRPLAEDGDNRVDQPEYIEIANVSALRLDLNGLRLARPPSDIGEARQQRIIFQPLTLEPGNVAVVYELPGAAPDDVTGQLEILAAAFPHAYPSGIERHHRDASLGRSALPFDEAGVLVPVRGAVSLPDDGDRLRLLGADGTILDTVSYSPASHHPAVVDPTGRALERAVLSVTPLELGHWSTSTFSGGGSPGLLPRRTGPPPSSPSAVVTARLAPRTFSPDGDGVDDSTVIRVDNLGNGSLVRADVFDIDGRPVRVLTTGTLSNETFTITWSGLDDALRPVARGFYVVLVRIESMEGDGRRAFRLPVALFR